MDVDSSLKVCLCFFPEINLFIWDSRGEQEVTWLSAAIQKEVQADRKAWWREENSGDSISSLSICINQPLFDAGGRQPSANRRTEVKLRKRKTVIFIQKIIPQEINNNYNYSKKKTTHQWLLSKLSILLLLRGRNNNSEERKTTRRLGDLY